MVMMMNEGDILGELQNEKWYKQVATLILIQNTTTEDAIDAITSGWKPVSRR